MSTKELIVRQQAALTSVERRISQLIPSGMQSQLSAARFTLMLLNRISANPKLAQCEPRSIVSFALEAAALGLLPGGPLAQIHPLPFGRTCTAVIDYRGYIALARRSGAIGRIHTDVIKEHDRYSYIRDPWPRLLHESPLTGHRGKTIAAYCIAQLLPDGETQIKVLRREEIDAAREKSPSGGKGAWADYYDAMACKTAIRRAAKEWTLTEELAAAQQLDDTGVSGAVPGEVIAAAIDESADAIGAPVSAADRAKAMLGGEHHERMEEAERAPAVSLEDGPSLRDDA